MTRLITQRRFMVCHFPSVQWCGSGSFLYAKAVQTQTAASVFNNPHYILSRGISNALLSLAGLRKRHGVPSAFIPLSKLLTVAFSDPSAPCWLWIDFPAPTALAIPPGKHPG